MAGLVRDLPDGELRTKVPASPAWTVRDVVAHVTGVAADVGGGSVPPELDLVRPLDDPTLAAHSGGDDRAAGRLQARAVAGGHPGRVGGPPGCPAGHDPGRTPLPRQVPFADAILVTDLAVHTQDVRGALGVPGDRDSAGVGIALASCAAIVGLRLRMRGLPALRLRYGSKERMSARTTVSLERRCRPIGSTSAGPCRGRRSRAQILAMEWDGDPGPYVDLNPAYGPREDDVVEETAPR
jgi:hypothetical protein